MDDESAGVPSGTDQYDSDHDEDEGEDEDDAFVREMSDILDVETRIKILEIVAALVFLVGWGIALWATFDPGDLGFGAEEVPLQWRLIQNASIGISATGASALLMLASFAGQGYTAWRRDRTRQ